MYMLTEMSRAIITSPFRCAAFSACRSTVDWLPEDEKANADSTNPNFRRCFSRDASGANSGIGWLSVKRPIACLRQRQNNQEHSGQQTTK
ncbi:MAG: hypothetical protein IPM82_16390 [Saprospiraceae bacterium]|nr:hypothetical protein [Saprospiraceae bacterium]